MPAFSATAFAAEIYDPDSEEQCRSQPVISVAMDTFVGIVYLVSGILGIALHVVEIVASHKLSRNNPGFYFICHHSAADILLLVEFGIWGGLVVLSGCEITTPNQRIIVNILINIPWWSMCYHSVLVTFTRLLCITAPMTFRSITHVSAQISCSLVWFIAILQSYVVTLFPWYVPLYYDSDGYSFAADWEAYANNGTRTYFYIFNGFTVFSSLIFYVIIVAKLSKMASVRRAIKMPPSTVGRDIVVSTVARSCSAAVEAVPSRESFRRSAEFGLLLSCFINWIGFVLEQLFINWLFFEGPVRDLLIVLVFMSQCWSNTVMRLCLSSILRKEVRRLIYAWLPLERFKCKVANNHSAFVTRR